MTDLALTPSPQGGFDLSLTPQGLATDAGLSTAVILSLELNARHQGQQGWWASVATPTSQELGSKLWLLKRNKTTAQTLLQAQQYAHQALSWLINLGVAQQVQVTPSRKKLATGTYALVLHIQITRANGSLYSTYWQAHAPTGN